MKGRPMLYQSAQLISRAQEIFWKKGYTATSMDDLFQVTGIGSGSFYNTFKKGKKEVFIKSILQRREAFNDFKKQLDASPAPLDLIKEFFRSIAGEGQMEHLKGCIIANSIVEMTFIDNDIEAEAVAILKETEMMFTEVIKKTQTAKGMINKTDACVLGRYLITFWCGLNTLRRMYPDKEILEEQIEMQLAILS